MRSQAEKHPVQQCQNNRARDSEKVSLVQRHIWEYNGRSIIELKSLHNCSNDSARASRCFNSTRCTLAQHPFGRQWRLRDKLLKSIICLWTHIRNLSNGFELWGSMEQTIGLEFFQQRSITFDHWQPSMRRELGLIAPISSPNWMSLYAFRTEMSVVRVR